MDDYELLIADPKLSRVERLAYQIIANLYDGQLRHRFDDPNAPPPPGLWKMLLRPRAAVQQWHDAEMEYYVEHGMPEPRSPLPLADLWPTIDPPRDLTPHGIQPNDIFFERFVLSQRIGDSEGWWYIAAAPTSNDSFRCLVQESSGRCFCSSQNKAHCGTPAKDDFSRLRIRTKAFDCKDPTARKPTIPTEVDVYLPGCYAPWSLMRGKRDDVDESIIGF